MAAQKIPVVFTKRVEDRDKKGNKIVIPAGTESDLTEKEYERVKHAVRMVKAPESKKPEAAATGDSGAGETGANGDAAGAGDSAGETSENGSDEASGA